VINGILNLDKPTGSTSSYTVNRVKRLLPRRVKIGHAGTLDSFATGVLLLLIGKATKLSESLMSSPKQYEATVRFGATTATDDPDSPEQLVSPAPKPLTREDLLRLLPKFTGPIHQTPPVFSALKIAGRRASDRARAGQMVVVQPRTVMVYGIELIDFNWPTAKLKIRCGRGTYIRSIARDLGEALRVGGYLTELRRTKVGIFSIDQAVTLERVTAEGVESFLSPVARN